MTMKIAIKNEDQARAATVAEETFTLGQAYPDARNLTILQAGDERSFYIHAAKRLLVTEDPEASIPAKSR